MWYQNKDGNLCNLDKFQGVFREGKYIKVDCDMQGELVPLLLDTFADEFVANDVMRAISTYLAAGLRLMDVREYIDNETEV